MIYAGRLNGGLRFDWYWDAMFYFRLFSDVFPRKWWKIRFSWIFFCMFENLQTHVTHLLKWRHWDILKNLAAASSAPYWLLFSFPISYLFFFMISFSISLLFLLFCFHFLFFVSGGKRARWVGVKKRSDGKRRKQNRQRKERQDRTPYLEGKKGGGA